MLSAEQNAQHVKRIAQDLGFSFCGISKAEFLEEHARPLEEWLKRNMHGQMAYMANHFDKRLDPRLLVPGAKSVITLLATYQHQEPSSSEVRVSKYAWSEDYHHVIKERMFEMVERMKEVFGSFDGRAFVDSAPVLDKAWAMRSGAGWMGKNGNVLNKSMGSFFFIAELIIDLALPEDGPVTDHCGTCTACIDACPTEAIIRPYVIDGSKCISYFTIELKDAFPAETPAWNDWIFGCDVCQDVCPWNRFAQPAKLSGLKHKTPVSEQRASDWLEMTEEVFKEITHRSPISRTGLEGMKRNVRHVLSHAVE
ncbi:MAG: tRNA epoxyqueuosine(34) reductase QueG [Flavobacteriales bacterium]